MRRKYWYEFEPVDEKLDVFSGVPDYDIEEGEAVRRFKDMCAKEELTPDEVLQTWSEGIRRGTNDFSPHDLRRGMYLMVESPALFRSVSSAAHLIAQGKPRWRGDHGHYRIA